MRAPRIASAEDLLADGALVVQRVLDRQLAVGELRTSKAVTRGPARSEHSFFEVLEADLVQAATLLSRGGPAAAAPRRRRIRWRP